MERVGGEETGQRTSLSMVAPASFIGSTVERYDFSSTGPPPQTFRKNTAEVEPGKLQATAKPGGL